MEIPLNPEKTTNDTERRKKAAREAARAMEKRIIKSHEDVPTPGLAAPEISEEYVAELRARDEIGLKKLKDELGAQMAVPKGERDAVIIEKLRNEIKELGALIKKGKHEAHPQRAASEEPSVDIDISEFDEKAETKPEPKERKPTIRTINLEIENLDRNLKGAIDRRLSALRSTNSASFRAAQKEISQIRDELTKLRAEREALREANKTFVKERMREALAHYESSKEERARHKKLSEAGITVDKIKEQELDKKDAERWNTLLALDAEHNRATEDYKLLSSNYEALEPEAVSGFMENLRAEAKTGNLDMQHAAAQIVADIEAGKIAGFTESESKFFAADAEEVRERTEAIETMGDGIIAEEAVSEWQKIKKQSSKEDGMAAEKKFFSASEKEAHTRAEAIETMGPEMTIDEAVAEWEKIKKQSAKGEKESRQEEEAFIDFLHGKYPDYVDFTGKEYSGAQTKPEKIGFFKKLFSFGKPKTRLEEMEEALDNIPNIGKLAGKFLLERKVRSSTKQKPLSVKMR